MGTGKFSLTPFVMRGHVTWSLVHSSYLVIIAVTWSNCCVLGTVLGISIENQSDQGIGFVSGLTGEKKKA